MAVSLGQALSFMPGMQTTPPATLPKRAVFKSLITTASTPEVVEAIFELAAGRMGSYVCFANVHMLMEADGDAGFQQILNQADLALPDGAPVALYLQRRYKQPQARQPGMDLLPLLLAEAAVRQKSVCFYGGAPHVLAALQARIAAELPTLKVVGAISPPYRALTAGEQAAYLDQINQADPDLLFVALGCPKQERWMAAHKGTIKACMLGVGQAFLTYAGLERRLPPALRKLPVEWLYRLLLEPRRLFKRYAITNSRFIWKVLRGH